MYYFINSSDFTMKMCVHKCITSSIVVQWRCVYIKFVNIFLCSPLALCDWSADRFLNCACRGLLLYRCWHWAGKNILRVSSFSLLWQWSLIYSCFCLNKKNIFIYLNILYAMTFGMDLKVGWLLHPYEYIYQVEELIM